MKVLLVNISLDAEIGGGTAERTRHLATHLASAGCKCEVVAMTGNSWQSEFDAKGVRSYITGRIGRRFPVPLCNPLRAWFAIRSADVLHIMGYWNLLSVFYGLLAVIARRPYVLCPAGEFTSIDKPRPIMKVFHKLLGQWLIKLSSGFIAITELERDLIARVAGVPRSSVPVVPNAVSEPGEFLSESIGLPTEPFILFMGRLAPVKGPDLLIQAYIDTPAAHRYPLIMAGPDFGMLEELERQVEDAGLAGQVKFVGFLNETQRIQAYRRALMLVIPSRSEAMSLVALEAGIVGVPVLLTDTCGFDQVQAIGGGEVVAASAEGIAQGLRSMLSDPNELQHKGARLKAFVIEHFTWTATVRSLVAHFKRLTRSGSIVE